MATPEAQLFQTRTALGLTSTALILFSWFGSVESAVKMPGGYFEFPGYIVFWVLAVPTFYFLISFILTVRAFPLEHDSFEFQQSATAVRNELTALHVSISQAMSNVESDAKSTLEDFKKALLQLRSSTIRSAEGVEGVTDELERMCQLILPVQNIAAQIEVLKAD